MNLDTSMAKPIDPKKPREAFEVEPRYFTLEQTATYLNVSVPQVYALVRSGELPAIKIGGESLAGGSNSSGLLSRRSP